jgi:hypothetical protein|tara:strand:- start:296 stop:412 length:117 start_codon:yes stop_codon:yes gene_type:complete
MGCFEAFGFVVCDMLILFSGIRFMGGAWFCKDRRISRE